MFVTLIVTSVLSSTLCATLAGLVVPVLIIPVLSFIAGFTTVLSVKFNLKGRSLELNKIIEQLDLIKRKIDFVVSCNENFTEAEYKQLILELTKGN